MKKIMQKNCAPKASPRLHFNFGKQPKKQPLRGRNSFKNKIF